MNLVENSSLFAVNVLHRDLENHLLHLRQRVEEVFRLAIQDAPRRDEYYFVVKKVTKENREIGERKSSLTHILTRAINR